jgi:peptide/nickel transport system permease protein
MHALRFVARRLVFAALLVFLVSSGALWLVRLAPGDYASDVFGLGANPETVARTRAQFGLDRPLIVQYGEWLGRAARLDLGTSLLYRRPFRGLIAERARNTALLAIISLRAATTVGLPLGALSGSRGGTLAATIQLVSVVCLSMPSLVTSLLLVYLAARTGWLPIGGMTSVGESASGFTGFSSFSGFSDVLWHTVLPATALALPIAATLERLQSQAMAETMGQPFILTAAARGLSSGRIVWRHAWRAAAGPVSSLYGFIFGTLLSGSFVVEIVTAWPGLGRLMYDALRARDIYLVAGCAAAGSLFLAVGSVISDVALAVADPRLRDSTGLQDLQGLQERSGVT